MLVRWDTMFNVNMHCFNRLFLFQQVVHIFAGIVMKQTLVLPCTLQAFLPLPLLAQKIQCSHEINVLQLFHLTRTFQELCVPPTNVLFPSGMIGHIHDSQLMKTIIILQLTLGPFLLQRPSHQTRVLRQLEHLKHLAGGSCPDKKQQHCDMT